MPASDWMLGKKSEIHHGLMACQLTSGGLPVAKYPYTHSAVPAAYNDQPITACFFISHPLKPHMPDLTQTVRQGK